MAEITTPAISPARYRHKLKAANRLGNLWVRSHAAFGEWETQDGEPVFFEGSNVQVEGHGRKYFQIVVDGDVEKVKPVSGGRLEITFTDNPQQGERVTRLLNL